MNTRYSSYWIRLCVTFLSGTALLCAVLVDQTLATPPPIITSDTSLNGGGATVDGNGGSGLFVQSGNVVVSNATMTNFSTKGGDGSGGGMANSLSLLELFELLRQKLELSQPLRFMRTPRRQSDQDFFVADVSKAKRLLGWHPQINTSVGIERMLAWVSGGSHRL